MPPLTHIPRRHCSLSCRRHPAPAERPLSRKLLAADANITMSVSVTTRKSRPGEVEGKDYFFISQAQFNAMVEGKQLLEYTRRCSAIPTARRARP